MALSANIFEQRLRRIYGFSCDGDAGPTQGSLRFNTRDKTLTAFDILKANLLSPVVLAFVLGIFTKLVKSELSLPKNFYACLSIYLLLAIGLKGGPQLSESSFQFIAWPAFATLALGCITPISAYLILRKLGKFEQIAGSDNWPCGF